MKIRKLLVGILCAVLAFPLLACDESGIDSISQNITSYKIAATYDGLNTVTATAEINYVNNYEVGLPEIKFHLYPNAFREGAKYSPVTEGQKDKAYPRGPSYGGITVEKLSRGSTELTPEIGGDDQNILVVPLADVLKPTSSIKLKIDFQLRIPYVRHRFGMTDKSVNLGNWYPIACVYSEGKFLTDPYYANGDPFYSAIANYDVTFTVPSNLKVAATGAVTAAAGAETTVYTCSAKAVRDFAAVIGGFEEMTATAGGTEVKYFYYSDPDPTSSLKAATDALTVFGEKYGVYPYKNYSVVETGFLQGGMEYPQLVMISDVLVPEMFKEAIIHETAHQWFYALVGNDQIRNAWLDEAIAEYSTSLFYKWMPSYEIDFEKRVSDALTGFILYCDLYKHGGKDDTSMNRAANEYANEAEYTYMTYVKGSLMLDSLRRTIGDDSFVTSLKKYVESYYLKIATPDCLIACFEKTSGRELKGFFDSWTSGKVMLFGD